MIRADGASLIYCDHGKEIAACNKVSLAIADGEFVGILGPSGSGKSSLLYLLSGLKNPTSGSIQYKSRDFSELSERDRSQLRLAEFGFVFQQPFLVGYLTSLENTLITNPGGIESVARAESLLESLGLAEKMRRMPSELSVGEKQRVCVARALFASPKVVFADEPTASLDHEGGAQVVALLRAHLTGALIMVTHDPTMAESADRVLHMDSGRLVENTPNNSG